HTFHWVVTADNGQMVPDGTGQSFSLTPYDNGTYTVTFTVTDTHGASGSDTAVVTVSNLPPVTDAGPTQTVNEGQQAEFVGTFTDPGTNDTHDTSWVVVDSGGMTVGSGSGLTFDFTPDDNDTFTVTFSVTDDDGGMGSTDVALTSLNVAPTADAGPDQMAAAGTVVTFTAIFTDPGTADTHTFLWEVEASNGQTVPNGTDQAISFTPDAAGTYTLTVTVADDDGGEGVDSAVLVVTEKPVYIRYIPIVENQGPSAPENQEGQLPKWPFLLLPALVLGFGRRWWQRSR
ncbi:MAG: PKD domain-containing protein, partial [Candidatus Promineifilaceae bacterium]